MDLWTRAALTRLASEKMQEQERGKARRRRQPRPAGRAEPVASAARAGAADGGGSGAASGGSGRRGVPRRARSLWRCLLWREGGVRVWGPVLVLVVLVNSYSRGEKWHYEWLLAMDTLAFSTIFLVPLCVGVAAYEAGRLGGQARDLLRVCPRGGRAVLATGLSVWLAALVAVAVGVVAVSATVLWRTQGYPPQASDLLPLVLVVGYTAVGCAAGTLLGWWWPSRLTPGLAALGAFALIMTMHITAGGVELVSVGGATGSLVGMRLLTEMVAWQMVFYIGAALLLTALTVMATGGGGRLRRAGCLAVVVVSLALASAGAGGASQFGASRFKTVVEPDLVCRQSHGLEVCAYPTYAALIPTTLERLSPYVKALQEAGVRAPTRAVQIGGDDQGGQALVLGTEDFVAANSGDPNTSQLLRSSLSGWFAPGSNCVDDRQSDEELDAGWLVFDWLELRVDGKARRNVSDPDRSLPDMTREEQDHRLHQAIDLLSKHQPPPQCQ